MGYIRKGKQEEHFNESNVEGRCYLLATLAMLSHCVAINDPTYLGCLCGWVIINSIQ